MRVDINGAFGVPVENNGRIVIYFLGERGLCWVIHILSMSLHIRVPIGQGGVEFMIDYDKYGAGEERCAALGEAGERKGERLKVLCI